MEVVYQKMLHGWRMGDSSMALCRIAHNGKALGSWFLRSRAPPVLDSLYSPGIVEVFSDCPGGKGHSVPFCNAVHVLRVSYFLRFGVYMGLFAKCKDIFKDGTWKKKYIHHRSILLVGHGEISLLYSVVSQTLIVWLALRDAFTIRRHNAIWILPCIMLGALVIQYLVGLFWERKKLVNEEQSWRFQRTNEVMEILNHTRKDNKHDGQP